VNNALGFVVTKTLVERLETKSILYGLHSLDAPPSVDEFKSRMGYHAKAVRQRVKFNTVVSPFFNSITHSMLHTAHKLIPSNPTIAKAEGLVRFYLQGRLPVQDQPAPELLSHY
jgi:hypothetical protein